MTRKRDYFCHRCGDLFTTGKTRPLCPKVACSGTLVRIPFRLDHEAFRRLEELRDLDYSVAHIVALGIVQASVDAGLAKPGELEGGVSSTLSTGGVERS